MVGGRHRTKLVVGVPAQEQHVRAALGSVMGRLLLVVLTLWTLAAGT